MATVSTMATADVVIEQAKARMREAAELIARGCGELMLAEMELEEHPDFRKTARARKRGKGGPITLAWWLRECLRSVDRDVRIGDAWQCLTEDADGGAERSLRTLITTEAREEAARRRSSAGNDRARVTAAA